MADVSDIMAGLANGSPYRPFGLPKKDLSGIVESKNYCCPNCGKEPPEVTDELYEVDGEKYPKYYNEFLCSTPDGTTHDWTEVHRCPYCKTEYRFRNGCF